MPTPADITIRPLSGVDDALHLQTVHGRIWGIVPADIVPTHIIVTMAANGGMVLGAFDSDGPGDTGGMVGFVLGWLGTTGTGRVKHVSHIAGILPAWRGRGLGVKLKLAQRDFVLAQGLTTHVTWTYDPLQRVNGAFNIRRLGATCTTYKVNVYGEMTDDLNKGMPSDRFQVDWHLTSQRVRHAVAHGRIPQSWDRSALHRLPADPAHVPSLPDDDAPVAVPLPASVSALQRDDRDQLLAWRIYFRGIMQQAFAIGYAVVDCVDLDEGLGWHYVLIREVRT
jgi:predicted GNAT superfamily acetyltransferase